MPKSSKSKDRKFTLQSFIRLLLFSLLVFILISYFSNQKGHTLGVQSPQINSLPLINEVSSSLWNSLPESSRQTLQNLPKNQFSGYISTKLEDIKIQADGFPQKQIKEIQKGIVKTVSEEIIKKIDQ